MATPTSRGPLATAWHHFPLKTHYTLLNLLLLAIPLAVGLHFAHAAPLLVFVAAAVAIIPLAGVLGEATEKLSAHSGPLIGGFLNATMGNATELIIAFFALRAGHIEVVKASLSGSIIGNMLLVLGLSLLVGGIGREKQTFSRTAAGVNSTMLFIAVAGFVLPAVFDLAVYGTLSAQNETIQRLSLWTSGVLMLIYFISFIFVMKTHKALFVAEHAPAGDVAKGSVKAAVTSLVIATAFIGWIAEIMVGEISAVTQSLGMTELFIGVIVVAIVGNAAEHSTAILVARKNQMDLAITIAVGSSTQIALFVGPLLVFLSMIVGKPMSLVFNAFELAAVALSVFIVEMISQDGESNWFEGAMLLALYVIIGICFYFVPA
jgi:Ca2+:H+ antiporter